MIPVALDPSTTNLAVAGNGAVALRRLRALRQAGAAEALLFADTPSDELKTAAGRFLRPLPAAAEISSLHALWIADLPQATAITLATQARALRVLVNVEDVPEYCDFHSVAEIRRGNLLLTISTNGAAPGLAGSIRRSLESCFGPEWTERVDEIAALRTAWRAEGVKMPEAASRINKIVAERCWLSCPQPH
jgi:precorrin-2 dehydrogenase/sirohydrochlorin ferrochelatase